MLSPRGPEAVTYEDYEMGRDIALAPLSILDNEAYVVRIKRKKDPSLEAFADDFPSKIHQVENLREYSIVKFVILHAGKEHPAEAGLSRHGIIFRKKQPPADFDEIPFSSEVGYFTGQLDIFGEDAGLTTNEPIAVENELVVAGSWPVELTG